MRYCSFDDQSAVRKAVLALANEGHSKIAIIIGEEENILSIQRLKAIWKASNRQESSMMRSLY